MASWARRSLAAETIFWAWVICCVLLTLRIRRRMSWRAGMGKSRSGGGRGLEDPRELLEGGLQAVGELALDVLLLRDVLEQRRVPAFQGGVELPLVPAALGGGGPRPRA